MKHIVTIAAVVVAIFAACQAGGCASTVELRDGIMEWDLDDSDPGAVRATAEITDEGMILYLAKCVLDLPDATGRALHEMDAQCGDRHVVSGGSWDDEQGTHGIICYYQRGAYHVGIFEAFRD